MIYRQREDEEEERKSEGRKGEKRFSIPTKEKRKRGKEKKRVKEYRGESATEENDWKRLKMTGDD